MAKKADPLAAWKQSVTPTPDAEKAYRRLEKLLKSLSGNTFTGASQKFPPKFALEISARAALHRGKRFASIAAVGDTLFLELIELDEAQRKDTKKILKGTKWNASDGYEITRFGDALHSQLEELIRSSAARFQATAKVDQKLTPYKPKSTFALPSVAAWTAPMSWTAPKVAPAKDVSRHIPDNAVFTRAEFLFTLAKSKGVGVQSWSETSLPGLLELEPAKKGQPPRVVAGHAIAFDGKAWSFRLVQKKPKSFMPLFVGEDHSHQSLASEELLKKYPIERVELQSVLSLKSGKAIRITLRSNFEIEPEDEFDEQDDE